MRVVMKMNVGNKFICWHNIKKSQLSHVNETPSRELPTRHRSHSLNCLFNQQSLLKLNSSILNENHRHLTDISLIVPKRKYTESDLKICHFNVLCRNNSFVTFISYRILPDLGLPVLLYLESKLSVQEVMKRSVPRKWVFLL